MIRRNQGSIGSEQLDKRLSEALNSIQTEETKFRAKYVNRWTIMFCDASRKISHLTNMDEEELKELVLEYREFVLDIVDEFDPPFISPGDGPQVVICFEEPEHAANAAIAIQNGLRSWRYRKDGGECFRPSIGLHTGEFVIKDGDLKQSNACNMGKRVETQADPGRIYISSTTFEALEPLNQYGLKFVGNVELKNIPEPQDIYSLIGKGAIQMAQKSKPAVETESAELKEEDQVQDIEGEMGMLVCDVSGSTKKFWMLGDREGNFLIDIFQKEVFLILRKYRATHIEQREGDMIVACFMGDKPIVNVLAAVEIQKNFFRRNTNLATRERQKIETSIGIHYGHGLIRNKAIVPNLDFMACKGIQDLAEANEICLSSDVRNLILEYSHFAMDDMGGIEIKGSEDPIHVFSLHWHKTTG